MMTRNSFIITLIKVQFHWYYILPLYFARDVLKDGGTAVDAAISALACNGAVHSHSMGLGGGFLMTIFKKSDEKTYFLNARETAPRYCTEDMFVNTTASPKRGIF